MSQVSNRALIYFSQDQNYLNFLNQNQSTDHVSLLSAFERIRTGLRNFKPTQEALDFNTITDQTLLLEDYEKIKEIFMRSLSSFSSYSRAPAQLKIPNTLKDKFLLFKEKQFIAFIKEDTTNYPTLNFYKNLLEFIPPSFNEQEILAELDNKAEAITTELNRACAAFFKSSAHPEPLSQSSPQIQNPQRPIQPKCSLAQSYHETSNTQTVTRSLPFGSSLSQSFALPGQPLANPFGFNPDLSQSVIQQNTQQPSSLQNQNLESLKKEELLDLLRDVNVFRSLHNSCYGKSQLSEFENDLGYLWRRIQDQYYQNTSIENANPFYFSQQVYATLKTTNFFNNASEMEIRQALETLKRQQNPHLISAPVNRFSAVPNSSQPLPSIQFFTPPIPQPFAQIPQNIPALPIQTEIRNEPQFSEESIKEFFKNPSSFETFFNKFFATFSPGELFLSAEINILKDFHNTVKNAYANRTQNPLNFQSLQRDVFVNIIDTWFITLKNRDISSVFNYLSIDPTTKIEQPLAPSIAQPGREISYKDFITLSQNPEFFHGFYEKIKALHLSSQDLFHARALIITFYIAVLQEYRKQTGQEFNWATCNRQIFSSAVESCSRIPDLKKPSGYALAIIFQRLNIDLIGQQLMSPVVQAPMHSPFSGKSKEQLLALLQNSKFFDKAFDFLRKQGAKTQTENHLLSFCQNMRLSLYRKRDDDGLLNLNDAEEDFFSSQIQFNLSSGWLRNNTAEDLKAVFERLP